MFYVAVYMLQTGCYTIPSPRTLVFTQALKGQTTTKWWLACVNCIFPNTLLVWNQKLVYSQFQFTKNWVGA